MPNKGVQLNKKEMDVYKKKLIVRRNEIVRRLSEFRNESKEVETDIAQDVADKAESSYTKEFLLSLSDVEREQLFQIDAALKRIERKEFGSCQMCQKEINRKRMNALPWTAYCIECQEKSESETS
ncbi:MAG: TraR/DksA family transcriptional regulator [Candidatus Aminicenantes bacterium]|nr:TraR/DksA family transcriptional regulator [Candidatus Aminicenantes bacterium]